jgi:hypothetical protein
MTAFGVSQNPDESLEPDAVEIERETAARVIYVAPVSVVVERGGDAAESS